MTLEVGQDPAQYAPSGEGKRDRDQLWESHTCYQRGLWWIRCEAQLSEKATQEMVSEVISEGKDCRRELLRASMVRRVYRVESTVGPIVVKHFLPKGLPRGLWDWVRGAQWRREWKALQEMVSKGIPVPDPVFVAERKKMGVPLEGMVASKEIFGALTLGEALAKAEGPLEELLRGLGCFVAQIHQKGLIHGDLHYDNVLVKDQGGILSFFLLDLHRIRMHGTVGEKERIWNLAQLTGSMSKWIGKKHKELLLKTYLAASGTECSSRAWLSKIERLERQMALKREIGRTARCMKDSSLFCRELGDGIIVRRRRDFPGSILSSITEDYTRLGGVQGKVIKKDRRTRVVFREENLEEGISLGLCIKEYKPKIRAIRLLGWEGQRAKRFWIGAWGVRVRGLPAPLVYAMWRPRLLSKKKGSGVVMERIHPASPLANYVHSVANCPRALKELLESLAELLKNMHAKGVYHRDMKASNILVRKQEDMLELFLLDLEDVCFKKRLSVRDRLKNLAQLDSSVPSCIGDLMRLRFLAFYARGDTEKEQLKRWARSIRELSIHMRDVG